MKCYQKKDRDYLLSLASANGLRNFFFANNLRFHEIGKEIMIYSFGDVFIMDFMHSSICIMCNGDDYPSAQISDFISSLQFSSIMGPEDAITPIESRFSTCFDVNHRELLKAGKASFRPKKPRNDGLRELFSPDDWEDLFDLYLRTPEFNNDFDKNDKEYWAISKAEKEYPFAGVGLYYKNKIISGAYLSSATKESAMVVGVATDPGWRGRGLATSAVSELLDIALNENNIEAVVLWYADDISKHIYTKLGFTSECNYSFLRKKRK